MSELTSDLANECTQEIETRATEERRAWRHRLAALRTNEFVRGLLRTCLLSAISFGPVPPMGARRHH
jgi:hypothetical protein